MNILALCIKIFFVKSAAGDAFYGVMQRRHAVFRLLGHQVKLGTVAGGNQYRLGKIVGFLKQAQNVPDPAAGKIEFFPYFHGGGLMIQT